MSDRRGPGRADPPGPRRSCGLLSHWPARDSSSLAVAADRFGLGDLSADRVAEFQRSAPYCECSLHHCLTFGTVADRAAILERQAIGIFEVDRLSPAVIDDVGDLYALVAQLVALLCQCSR